MPCMNMISRSSVPMSAEGSFPCDRLLFLVLQRGTWPRLAGDSRSFCFCLQELEWQVCQHACLCFQRKPPAAGWPVLAHDSSTVACQKGVGGFCSHFTSSGVLRSPGVYPCAPVSCMLAVVRACAMCAGL